MTASSKFKVRRKNRLIPNIYIHGRQSPNIEMFPSTKSIFLLTA